ncbi:MAG: hypothetical protein OXE78_06925 [Gammaproteobacteria bacterium]|nr:hypothetical protein [Gammaproteobacteria bacterium]
MKTITINEKTFERLQRHAKPLVDDADTVLNRALDALESIPVNGDAIVIDETNLSDLMHSKFLYAKINGEEVSACSNWLKLHNHIILLAMSKLSDFKKVTKLSSATIVEGRSVDKGFYYIQEANISTRRMAVSSICKSIIELSRAMNISIEIGFEWRQKYGAVHPGEKGLLVVKSKSQV